VKNQLIPRRKKGRVCSFGKAESAPCNGKTQKKTEGQLSFGFQLPEKKPEHANPLWWLIDPK
jgi:hypothetical protein